MIQDKLGVNWEYYERQMRDHAFRADPAIIPRSKPLLREIALGLAIGFVGGVGLWGLLYILGANG